MLVVDSVLIALHLLVYSRQGMCCCCPLLARGSHRMTPSLACTSPKQPALCFLIHICSGSHRLRLKVIIEHVGASVHSGHYLTHVRQDDGTYLTYDDERVRTTNQLLEIHFAIRGCIFTRRQHKTAVTSIWEVQAVVQMTRRLSRRVRTWVARLNALRCSSPWTNPKLNPKLKSSILS